VIVRLTLLLSAPVVDHTVRGEAISLDNPLDLAYAAHLHGCIALNRLRRHVKGSKLSTRSDTAFHKLMMLFDDMIHRRTLPEQTSLRSYTVKLEGVERVQ
jgi:hypothetical protein